MIGALPEPLLDVVRINKLSLIKILEGTNIKMITLAKVQAITRNGIEYLDHEGKPHTLSADTVILAKGFIRRLQFQQLFKESAPKIHMAGNCRNPGKIIDAINQGAMVALKT